MDPLAHDRPGLHGAPDEPAILDEETAAFVELGRRASRLRGRVALVLALAGMLGGMASYLVLRDIQMTINGAHSPYLTGLASVGVLMAASLYIAQKLGRALCRMRAPSWIDELAQRHRVPREKLEEATQLW
jgi:hypothetical protein